MYLVVDSDLDRLTELNSGTVPIWGDYCLPRGFQFVYASADVGNDLPLSRVMAECDEAARHLLDRVIRSDSDTSGIEESTLMGGVPLRRWSVHA